MFKTSGDSGLHVGHWSLSTFAAERGSSERIHQGIAGGGPSERIAFWPSEQLRRVAQCLLVLVEHFAYHTTQHVARWRKSTKQREAVRSGQQQIGRSASNAEYSDDGSFETNLILLKLAALRASGDLVAPLCVVATALPALRVRVDCFVPER